MTPRVPSQSDSPHIPLALVHELAKLRLTISTVDSVDTPNLTHAMLSLGGEVRALLISNQAQDLEEVKQLFYQTVNHLKERNFLALVQSFERFSALLAVLFFDQEAADALSPLALTKAISACTQALAAVTDSLSTTSSASLLSSLATSLRFLMSFACHRGADPAKAQAFNHALLLFQGYLDAVHAAIKTGNHPDSRPQLVGQLKELATCLAAAQLGSLATGAELRFDMPSPAFSHFLPSAEPIWNLARNGEPSLAMTSFFSRFEKELFGFIERQQTAVPSSSEMQFLEILSQLKKVSRALQSQLYLLTAPSHPLTSIFPTYQHQLRFFILHYLKLSSILVEISFRE